jgi:hypothetical protein
LLILALQLFAHQAWAATGFYLIPVYADEGLVGIDYRYWNAKSSGRAPVGAPEGGVSYGVDSRWSTEVLGTWTHTDAGGTALTGQGWQNDVLLTQGQYPFDLAIHTLVQRYQQRNRGMGVEIGPTLQTELGRTQFNFNVFLTRDYRGQTSATTQLAYQWQIKYRWKSALQFGAQGFGEPGQWDNWASAAQQSHRVGPALSGSFYFGDNRSQELRYETAYLIGKNNARDAKSVTLRIQYLF